MKFRVIGTLQTNGTMLDNLPTEYLDKFQSILVSLDGDEAITDLNREQGTHAQVMQALRNLRDRGYTGELVGRMVITEDSDPYNDILWFFSVEYPKFDGVHWQCNFEIHRKRLLERY